MLTIRISSLGDEEIQARILEENTEGVFTSDELPSLSLLGKHIDFSFIKGFVCISMLIHKLNLAHSIKATFTSEVEWKQLSSKSIISKKLYVSQINIKIEREKNQKSHKSQTFLKVSEGSKKIHNKQKIPIHIKPLSTLPIFESINKLAYR